MICRCAFILWCVFPIASVMGSMEGWKAKIKEQGEEIAALKAQLATTQSERDTLDRQVADFTTRNASLVSDKQALITETQTLGEQIATLTREKQEELDAVTSERDTLDRQVADLTTQNESLASDKQTLITETQTQTQGAQIDTLTRGIQEAEALCTALQAKNAALEQHVRDALQQKKAVEVRNAALTQEVGEKTTRLTNLNKTVLCLNDKVSSLEKSRETQRRENDKIEKALAKEIIDLHGEIDLLKKDKKRDSSLLEDIVTYLESAVSAPEETAATQAVDHARAAEDFSEKEEQWRREKLYLEALLAQLKQKAEAKLIEFQAQIAALEKKVRDALQEKQEEKNRVSALEDYQAEEIVCAHNKIKK